MAQFRDLASAHDTIVAQATPRGAGAIAIVRLSGAASAQIVATLTRRCSAEACSEKTASLPASHRLARRTLRSSDGAVLDAAMVVHMRGPRSYTGEDVAELHLHGSQAVVDAVLAACLRAGARLATPGEFTRRAFLAGKLTLTQAEGVGALVSAESEQQRRAALRLLDGQAAQTLEPALAVLEGVVAGWRAALDFPDEVDASQALPQALAALAELRLQLQGWLDGAQKLQSASPQVVLLGDSNVGKSTLLNALTQASHALVDAEAGTTRDALVVPHVAQGVQLSLTDTAGLRAGAMGVEARGIAVAKARAQSADLRLWLTGRAACSWPTAELTPAFVVCSQADLLSAAERAAVQAEAQRRGLGFVGFVSGQTGEGVAALNAWLAMQLQEASRVHAAGQVLTLRHRGLLAQCIAALEDCAGAAAGGLPLDCLLAEAELAAARLGEVLGKDVDAAILDRIFADFCLGK